MAMPAYLQSYTYEVGFRIFTTGRNNTLMNCFPGNIISKIKIRRFFKGKSGRGDYLFPGLSTGGGSNNSAAFTSPRLPATPYIFGVLFSLDGKYLQGMGKYGNN